jgi:molybdopterin synthase sulfur carrier subunit
MVKVRFLLFATLRDKYNRKEVEVECNGTLRDAVLKASEQLGKEFYGEIFENNTYRGDRIILINGRHIQFVSSQELRDGDTIAVFPPIAGG